MHQIFGLVTLTSFGEYRNWCRHSVYKRLWNAEVDSIVCNGLKFILIYLFAQTKILSETRYFNNNTTTCLWGALKIIITVNITIINTIFHLYCNGLGSCRGCVQLASSTHATSSVSKCAIFKFYEMDCDFWSSYSKIGVYQCGFLKTWRWKWKLWFCQNCDRQLELCSEFWDRAKFDAFLPKKKRVTQILLVLPFFPEMQGKKWSLFLPQKLGKYVNKESNRTNLYTLQTCILQLICTGISNSNQTSND